MKKRGPRDYLVPEYEPTLRVRGVGGEYLTAPHWPFKRVLLGYVEREMAGREHCLVRAVKNGIGWNAIEGSHRLWIAHKLGIVVDVQAVDGDYRLQHDNPELGIVTAWQIIDVGPEIRGPVARYRIEAVK